jgi:predicted TPR repeat methyltransferase
MTGKHDGHLGAVYDAKDSAEVAALYDSWAETYDAEMAVAGYRHPSVGLSILTRHLPRGAAPLLDAGAGTGLMGEWLGIVGYPNVEALDISQGMLAMAARKGHYSALHNLALGGALPFGDGAYAGIVSTGVFTTGHVGAEALDELIRICAKDGVIVMTIKDTLWNDGFATRLAELQNDGLIRLVDETKPYASMPGEVGTILSRAIALRVL